MATWNQGDLFVAILNSQIHPEFKESALIVVEFKNLGVDQSFFNQCLVEAFAGDVDVVGVSNTRVEFTRSAVLDQGEKEGFLEEKATLLLAKLSVHQNWGVAGGPNLKHEYETME